MFIICHFTKSFLGSHLGCDLASGIFFTFLSEFLWRYLFTINTKFPNRIFNWQSMSIPAWEEWCIVALHGMRSDNNILNDTVHCRTGMQVAIGIWWTIMQHKRLMIPVLFQNLVIVVILFPFFKDAWFFNCQITTHFKRGIKHL